MKPFISFRILSLVVFRSSHWEECHLNERLESGPVPGACRVLDNFPSVLYFDGSPKTPHLSLSLTFSLSQNCTEGDFFLKKLFAPVFIFHLLTAFSFFLNFETTLGARIVGGKDGKDFPDYWSPETHWGVITQQFSDFLGKIQVQ